MASIPELLDGHITLEVECLDRLYLDGYIGRLAAAHHMNLDEYLREVADNVHAATAEKRTYYSQRSARTGSMVVARRAGK